jgi:hypothetical protein
MRWQRGTQTQVRIKTKAMYAGIMDPCVPGCREKRGSVCVAPETDRGMASLSRDTPAFLAERA